MLREQHHDGVRQCLGFPSPLLGEQRVEPVAQRARRLAQQPVEFGADSPRGPQYGHRVHAVSSRSV